MVELGRGQVLSFAERSFQLRVRLIDQSQKTATAAMQIAEK